MAGSCTPDDCYLDFHPAEGAVLTSSKDSDKGIVWHICCVKIVVVVP